MEDIAREAGINRALLHYYFRSKDKLFELIFSQRVAEFFSGLAMVIRKDAPLMEKIRGIINHDIDMIIAHPDLPIFILQELSLNPDRLVTFAQRAGFTPAEMLKPFFAEVKRASSAGEIRATDGLQLLIHIMSLSIYPFIAKPMIQHLQGLDEEGFAKMMTKRKTIVADFVIAGLKP